MPWKTDDSGTIVVEGGKPVYIYQDGKEVPFDADQATQKISELSREQAARRKENESLTARLHGFEGLDPEKARAALETVSNLDAKKLVDAGEVEKVKEDVAKAFKTKLAEKDEQITEREQRIWNLMVRNRFSQSPYFVATNGNQPKTVLPPDIAEQYFGRYFKSEGDQVVAYINGEKLLSRARPGEVADFDEALSIIIDAYPRKDQILRSTGATGSGAPSQTGTPGGSPRKLTPEQAGKLSPSEYKKARQEGMIG